MTDCIVIEFWTKIGSSLDERLLVLPPSPERFRVLIADDRVTAFVGFLDDFRKPAWARIVDEDTGPVAYGGRADGPRWTAPLSANRVIALAMARWFEMTCSKKGPDGMTVVDLGEVAR